MSLRRVGVLLGKELFHGSRSFLFVFAVVIPLVISLFVSLAFGTLFTGKPALGIVDQGRSRFPELAGQVDSLVVREYSSAEGLRQAVQTGRLDMGIVLPAGFDASVSRGEPVQLTSYVWGQSLLQDRAVLGVAVASLTRHIAGQESPLEIVTEVLGNAEALPWSKRLLPFIVLFAVMIGGTMVPATSLVEEKQRRTLKALMITPTSLGEVFAAKGLLGIGLSTLVGTITLALNRAFGTQPTLLLLMLFLGTCMAAVLGILLGALTKDINTLFATIKALGILLYAPALVYMFPQIPAWVGRIFPTYYIIGPIVEISQQGGGWPEVAPDVFVLVGLILALLAVVSIMSKRLAQREG